MPAPRADGGRGGRRGLVLAGALALAAAWPARADAQDAPAAGLTLHEAVRSAVEHGAAVRQARERVAASAGSARAATAPFDAQLRTFVGSSREHVLGYDGPGAPAVEPSHATGVTYGLGLDKRFRSGIVVGPELRAERVGNTPHVEARNNTASAALLVRVPLLQGRGAAVNTAPERAAAAELDAAGAALLHTAAQSARDAALAYWDYAAATERLAAQREAEQRAARLVEETRALVQAEERPAADLNQLRANLALKAAARIAAEQELVAAREALGLAMGLEGVQAAALPTPATPLPGAGGARPGAADVPSAPDALARGALERRADLAAAQRQSEGAALLERAARDAARPRLDVQVSAGYTGAEPGQELSQLFTPFYRSASGWTAALEVSWEAWARNAGARGEAERSRAVLRERELAAGELARSIRAGVVVASAGLRNAALELERAEEAVGLYRQVVEAEKRKFSLGMSTLFDVIQAEDALTSALTGRVAAGARYAAAEVRLAYETGTLVRPEGGEMVVSLPAPAPR